MNDSIYTKFKNLKCKIRSKKDFWHNTNVGTDNANWILQYDWTRNINFVHDTNFTADHPIIKDFFKTFCPSCHQCTCNGIYIYICMKLFILNSNTKNYAFSFQKIFYRALFCLFVNDILYLKYSYIGDNVISLYPCFKELMRYLKVLYVMWFKVFINMACRKRRKVYIHE